MGAAFILWKIRKRIPISLSVYSWAMFLLIMGKIDDNNAIVSTSRYLLSIYPIFIGQAILIKNNYLKLSYFLISLITQLILLVLFYFWYWVA
jgi:hypothetical protein